MVALGHHSMVFKPSTQKWNCLMREIFKTASLLKTSGQLLLHFFHVLYKASNKVIQKFQFFLLMVLYYSDASIKVVP